MYEHWWWANPKCNLRANFFWKRRRFVVIKVIHCPATPPLAPISTSMAVEVRWQINTAVAVPVAVTVTTLLQLSLCQSILFTPTVPSNLQFDSIHMDLFPKLIQINSFWKITNSIWSLHVNIEDFSHRRYHINFGSSLITRSDPLLMTYTKYGDTGSTQHFQPTFYISGMLLWLFEMNSSCLCNVCGHM